MTVTEWMDDIARTGLCHVCRIKQARLVCVSKDLFGNECIRKTCKEHACTCGRGEKMTIEAYLARRN